MFQARSIAIEIDDIDLHLGGLRVRQTFICAPSSTTRSEGRLKKSGALAACLLIAMNSRSCHCGMPEFCAAFSVLRPRKNEVVMMSNFRPALRIAASARGMCGCSINPKWRVTRVKSLERDVISNLLLSATRGVVSVRTFKSTIRSCRTLLCLRLCIRDDGAEVGSLVRKTAVPGTRTGFDF